MKTSIVYHWEPTDPPLTFIGDAVGRLMSFILYSTETKSFSKGIDGLGLKSYVRVLGPDGFTENDVRELAAFLNTLAGRANCQYKDADIADAPWRDVVLKDAAAAVAAADQLLKLFYERAPNIKQIAEAPAAPVGGQTESAPVPVPVTPQTPTPTPTTETPKP